MSNIEHWDALAKVSTVAEQMRRRAENAEQQAERMGDAADEFWLMIERLEAQLAGAVEALREIERMAVARADDPDNGHVALLTAIHAIARDAAGGQ